jgi:glutaminase
VNRRIANLLESRAMLSGNPADAVDLYTRQSSLAVGARDLAAMGATLALGGVNHWRASYQRGEMPARAGRHDDGAATAATTRGCRRS